jgi:phosphoribosylformylglycinamidine synthase subunit PurQ / glutaminase
MNVTILQFPGTNCEYDTQYAFERLGASVNLLWYKSNIIPLSTDLVVLPGGFSYGDYLRSGAIARFAPIIESLIKYANNGGNVLGICNGFQILLEAGLLPGAMKRNSNLNFISKYQYLKVISNDNSFLNELSIGDILNIPIAHHDGNYFIDENGLKDLEANNQILLKYCNLDGEFEDINGSISNIAGISNKNNNVFGLMPHPERAMEMLLNSNDGSDMLKGFFN